MKDSNYPFPLRASALNPDGFPPPYRELFTKLLAESPDQWGFAALREDLQHPSAVAPSSNSLAPHRGTTLALQKIAEAAKVYQEKIHQMASQNKDSIERIGA